MLMWEEEGEGRRRGRAWALGSWEGEGRPWSFLLRGFKGGAFRGGSQ